jgi:hypothetical protein
MIRRTARDCGGLAGAVRAEHAEHAALLEFEIDAVERRGLPVALDEAVSLDGECHVSSWWVVMPG